MLTQNHNISNLSSESPSPSGVGLTEKPAETSNGIPLLDIPVFDEKMADYQDDGNCRRNWGIAVHRGTVISELEELVAKVSREREAGSINREIVAGVPAATTSADRMSSLDLKGSGHGAIQVSASLPNTCSVCGRLIPVSEPFHETYCKGDKSNYPPSAYAEAV